MSFLLDTGILLRLPNRNDPEHQNINQPHSHSKRKRLRSLSGYNSDRASRHYPNADIVNFRAGVEPHVDSDA